MIKKFVFLTFFLFSCLGVLRCQAIHHQQCTASNVEIFPKDRTIFLLANSTLEVECRINDTRLCRSDEISFWDRDKKIDSKYVEVSVVYFILFILCTSLLVFFSIQFSQKMLIFHECCVSVTTHFASDKISIRVLSL